MSTRHREGALTPSLQALGRRLKDKRIETGITQEQAAEGSGVSVQAVRNWEAGRHEPTYEHLVALVSLYGVNSPNQLLEAFPELGDVRARTRRVSIEGYLLAGPEQHGDSSSFPIPESILRIRPNVFALWVTGDSLTELGISDGDVVLVDPDTPLGEAGVHIFQVGGAIFAGVVDEDKDECHASLRFFNHGEEALAAGQRKHLGKAVYQIKAM